MMTWRKYMYAYMYVYGFTARCNVRSKVTYVLRVFVLTYFCLHLCVNGINEHLRDNEAASNNSPTHEVLLYKVHMIQAGTASICIHI